MADNPIFTAAFGFVHSHIGKLDELFQILCFCNRGQTHTGRYGLGAAEVGLLQGVADFTCKCESALFIRITAEDEKFLTPNARLHQFGARYFLALVQILSARHRPWHALLCH